MMHRNQHTIKIYSLHAGLLALLALLHFFLPDYHHDNLARIMVLAGFACAYNISYGYAGLLSLGHAMFFACGMYACSLAIVIGGMEAWQALIFACVIGAIVGSAVALLTLRCSGAAFMIVTLMLAQASYLAILYFANYTRGDEGFVIAQNLRHIGDFDLSHDTVRYFSAYAVFAVTLLLTLILVRSPMGRVWIALKENPERTSMSGYNVFLYRFWALLISAILSALAGASYVLLFGYVGASFAEVQYSILPLLWVLVGGAGTVIGAFIGTLFMFYVIDLSSDYISAYGLVVGVVLVFVIVVARRGIMGSLKHRFVRWLP